jgi:LysM repeat protein
MKSIFSAFQVAFRQKMFVRLAVVAVLSLVGFGAFAVSQPSAHADSCFYYTVHSGDTLSQIALRYRSSVEAIGYANNIANVNLIYPDQRFCIPTGTQYTEPSAPAPVSAAPAQPVQVQAQAPSSSQSYSGGSVTSMIEQVFGPYAASALNVARCESGLNPGASNPSYFGGSHAVGVFQILYPSTWDGTSEAASSPYDAMSNILAAHDIFVRDGYSWREWTCQP